MAQALKSVTISAPGFLGLNTQDSQVGLNPAFASVADNAVIDKYGRLGARNGYSYVTTTATELGSSLGLEALHHHTESDGTEVYLSAGNNKILSGTTTLVDETPGAYSITANNWKIVSFNGNAYFFQRGFEPLVYQESTGTVVKMTSATGAAGTPPQGNEGLAAYGRLWCADISSDKSTVYWSDLLNGADWTGGTSGSIDVTKFWPTGFDEIVALADHNGLLIVFGKRSILIFGGAESPSTMQLVDSVTNIGCVERDTVESTGSDLLFFSETGVRSLQRTIQEKSLPFNDISKNVRDDIIEVYRSESSPVKAVYSRDKAFYVLAFRDASKCYCFDTRFPLEDGSFRATTWSGINPLCFEVIPNGSLYMGHPSGISHFTGYTDNSAKYHLLHYSVPLDFDQPTLLKFIKKFLLTIIGGQSTVCYVKWSYDYTGKIFSAPFTFSSADPAYYGEAEYGEAEYSAEIVTNTPKVHGRGSGKVCTVGIEALINGNEFSIQKIDVLALLGRIL